eukprot:2309710-Rhodomonas_salina.1
MRASMPVSSPRAPGLLPRNTFRAPFQYARNTPRGGQAHRFWRGRGGASGGRSWEATRSPRAPGAGRSGRGRRRASADEDERREEDVDAAHGNASPPEGSAASKKRARQAAETQGKLVGSVCLVEARSHGSTAA